MYKFLIVDRKQKEDGKKRERERKSASISTSEEDRFVVQRVNKTEGAAKERTKRRKKEEGKKRSKRDYDEEWR